MGRIGHSVIFFHCTRCYLWLLYLCLVLLCLRRKLQRLTPDLGLKFLIGNFCSFSFLALFWMDSESYVNRISGGEIVTVVAIFFWLGNDLEKWGNRNFKSYILLGKRLIRKLFVYWSDRQAKKNWGKWKTFFCHLQIWIFLKYFFTY